MNTTDRETLWRQLSDAGLAQGDMPALSASPSPWYVRTMLGVAGWIGALFLLAFVGAGLSFLFDSQSAAVAVGLACCGTAYAIFLKAGKNDLASQFALAVSLAGQVMFVFGIADAVGDGRDSAGLPLAIAVFEGVLALTIPNFVHRVWSTLASMVGLGYALNVLTVPGLATGIVAAGLAYLWLTESQWLPRSAVWRPIGFGLAFALLQFDALAMLGAADLWYGRYESMPPRWIFWIGPVIVAATLIYVVMRLLDRHGAAPGSRTGLAALGASAVIALATLKAPGVAAALLILVLGFSGGNRTLFGVGVLGMLGYLSHFYYSLEATLLMKSAALIVTGLVLIALWAGTRWIFGPAPGKPGKEGVAHA
jgi:hypothetical protein